VLLLAGCATAQSEPRPNMEKSADEISIQTTGGTPLRLTVDRDPSRHKVAAPVRTAWPELGKVYEELKIPLEFADHRANRLGNTRFNVTRQLAGKSMSTFLRCGIGQAGQLADTHRIRMSIITELKPAGDSTAVFTQIDARATPVDGTNTTVTVCSSSGALESAIVGLLKYYVGETARKPRG
jgi:hypothetical protein